MLSLNLFTDGGARGNPGPASCAFVVARDAEVLFEKADYLGVTTNNVAEYQGLINGLSWVLNNYQVNTHITVNMDSLLIVSQVNGIYKVKDAKLKILYQQTIEIIQKIKVQGSHMQIKHIPRKQNDKADFLVNQCLDKEKPTRETLS